MKYCIDTNQTMTWDSFCGKYEDIDIDEMPRYLEDLFIYMRFKLNNEMRNREWCPKCENDPRLTLKLLDNIEL